MDNTHKGLINMVFFIRKCKANAIERKKGLRFSHIVESFRFVPLTHTLMWTLTQTEGQTGGKDTSLLLNLVSAEHCQNLFPPDPFLAKNACKIYYL